MVRRRARVRSAGIGCEWLEARRLLSGLVVSDTAGVDTIVLGQTESGGIKVVMNGVETDYQPGQWDSVLLETDQGADKVNIEATVVATVVHYAGRGVHDYPMIVVGSASGVQNLKAPLNFYGTAQGLGVSKGAQIDIDDSGNSAARTINMVVEGSDEKLDGIAPAEITFGLDPLHMPTFDTLGLETGGGADVLRIGQLREGLVTIINNSEGNDVITVGDGLLSDIQSTLILSGRSYSLPDGNSTLLFDDSLDPQSAQFVMQSTLPPTPRPLPGVIDLLKVTVGEMPTQVFQFRVAEFLTVTLDGGDGGNRFTVQGYWLMSGESRQLVLNTGGGNDTVQVVAPVKGSAVSVHGGAGDDSIATAQIAYAVTGNLQLDGGEGNNDLTVIGPVDNPTGSDTDPVEVGAGQIEHHGVIYQYSDISTLRLENGYFRINEELGPMTLVIKTDASTAFSTAATRGTINVSQHLAGLEIVAPVVVKAGSGAVIATDSFMLGAGGLLDVGDGKLQVHYGSGASPFSAIRASVFAHAIMTSSADGRHTLGYVDSADGVNPALPTQTVIVTYALKGDANLDRSVNFADLVLVAQHYGLASDANWDSGDFDLDGKVGFSDLVIVAQNYGQSEGPAVSAAAALARASAPVSRADVAGGDERLRRRRP